MDIKTNRQARKYSSREQLYRVFWMFGQILFRISFRTMFGWRRFVLRLFGSKIGVQVNVYNTVRIYMPWNLEIGDYSSIGEYAYIYNLGKIRIGKSTTISQRVHLCAGTHDYTDPAMPLLKLPISINDQSWICADSFIGPDVIIGEGAVVGARAVVTKNVNDWNVVAGNPARVIKKRKLRAKDE